MNTRRNQVTEALIATITTGASDDITLHEPGADTSSDRPPFHEKRRLIGENPQAYWPLSKSEATVLRLFASPAPVHLLELV